MECKSENTIKFYFDETDESYGSVTLRVCPPDEKLKITKRVDKPLWKVKSGQRVNVGEFNTELFYKLYYNYCIVDWENIILDGQEAECNDVNKNKIMLKVATISAFISKKLDELTEEVEEGNLAKN